MWTNMLFSRDHNKAKNIRPTVRMQVIEPVSKTNCAEWEYAKHISNILKSFVVNKLV